MFHYIPSSRVQGHTSHLPRRSYFPASFDIDDAPSSTYGVEDLGYRSLSHSYLPPRIDAETRYRRALHELEAAEQEYQAHVVFERAREAAAIHQHAALEVARREREIALYAEVERINRARVLQEQVKEGLGERRRALRTHAGFEGAHRAAHDLLRAIYGDGERFSVPEGHAGRARGDNKALSFGDLLGVLGGVQPEHQHVLRTQAGFDGAHGGGQALLRAIYGDRERDSVAEGQPAGPQSNDESLTIGDLLGLFSEVDRERQRTGPPQGRTSPSSSQPHHPTEPHTQPQSREQENGDVNFSNILEFFQSIAAQARGAVGGEPSSDEQSSSSQGEATHVDGKGKGKAKAEPVPEPTIFETFRQRMNGARDQELRDIEYAIKLSLEDRDASDVKKAHGSKAAESSPGACSSRVKVQDPSSSGVRGASPTRNATSPSVSGPVREPISPLTSIRAVRTRFSALESAFKFPPILDFDHSELAVSSNNAPVRAYEHALNDLLEQLDGIESDGNEEVRDVRREVVREVERALEEVERKVKERAPQAPVPEVTKQEARGKDAGASSTNAVVHVSEAAEPTQAVGLVPVASQADADIDVVISAEYQSASPVAGVSGVVVAEGDSVTGGTLANRGASIPRGADTEAVPASEEASDSIATITPASVAPGVPVPSSPSKSASTSGAGAETFLTSLSHDQFTFPPRPAFSQSSTNSGLSHDDDAVLVDNSSERGSVRSVEDGWTTEFDA